MHSFTTNDGNYFKTIDYVCSSAEIDDIYKSVGNLKTCGMGMMAAFMLEP